MKKLLLLGLLLSLSTGCGGGWRPSCLRGASCGNGGCGLGAAPPLPQGCNTCAGGNSAGYGNYEGQVVGGETIVGDSYVGNSYPGNSYAGSASGGETYVGPGPAENYGSGALSAPSMAPLPNRAP